MTAINILKINPQLALIATDMQVTEEEHIRFEEKILDISTPTVNALAAYTGVTLAVPFAQQRLTGQEKSTQEIATSFSSSLNKYLHSLAVDCLKRMYEQSEEQIKTALDSPLEKHNKQLASSYVHLVKKRQEFAFLEQADTTMLTIGYDKTRTDEQIRVYSSLPFPATPMLLSSNQESEYFCRGIGEQAAIDILHPCVNNSRKHLFPNKGLELLIKATNKAKRIDGVGGTTRLGVVSDTEARILSEENSFYASAATMMHEKGIINQRQTYELLDRIVLSNASEQEAQDRIKHALNNDARYELKTLAKEYYNLET
ncbi:MAG: hypothetical protein ACMXYD_01935 [Candidatus Woesearchaeota archaeon]